MFQIHSPVMFETCYLVLLTHIICYVLNTLVVMFYTHALLGDKPHSPATMFHTHYVLCFKYIICDGSKH